jgi:hypothetical protein
MLLFAVAVNVPPLIIFRDLDKCSEAVNELSDGREANRDLLRF